ncbi:hypothetical protein IX51_11570 [uncultured archaeon]|nr:hypothetical protein IX51_11570 [uncultured archaeon]
MNIGFFTETYYPTPDGVSHYLRDIKKELEAMGHEVFVFTLAGDTTEKNVFKPYTIPLFLYMQYRVPVSVFPFNLYRKMLKTKLDVVNIHSSFFMGTLGYRIARAKNIPIIATFHTDFSKMKESINMPMKDTFFWISWRYNLFLYRRCDAVLCPSSSTADAMRKNGMHRVEELTLFVDTEKFSNGKPGNGRKVVQYIGRLTKDKGIEKIVKLADHMRNDSEVRFSISGIGPEEHAIKKMVGSLGLSETVSLNGYVSEDRKLNTLKESSIFIHPSESDTFGLAVLEALSTGKPALVSENFPLLSYCDGECGMVPVDFSNIEETAATLKAVLLNEGRYRELSEKATAFARTKFSPKKHAEKLLEVYQSFMK